MNLLQRVQRSIFGQPAARHIEVRVKGSGSKPRSRSPRIHPRNKRDLAPAIRRTLRNPRALEALREAAPGLVPLLGIDSDGARSIDQGPRDLPDLSRQVLLARNEHLATFNGIARRGLQIRSDLVTSGGLKPIAISEDPKVREAVQRALDEHWTLNRWDELYFKRYFNSSITGEYIRIRRPQSMLPVINGVRHQPGRFRAGTFHPCQVTRVRSDPWDLETFKWLELAHDPDSDEDPFSDSGLGDIESENDEFNPHSDPDRSRDHGGRGVRPRTIQKPGVRIKIANRTGFGIHHGRVVGDAFYLPFNSILGMTRGLGDLVPAQEWIDLHQTMQLTGAERSQLALSFLTQIVKKGATPEQIEERAAELGLDGLTPGSLHVTAEDEEWRMISPDLAADDIRVIIDILFEHIWGTLGIPLHWFTASESVNRASGENMDDPLFMWARGRRREFEGPIGLELELALQDSRENGALKFITRSDGAPLKKVDLSFTLVSVDPDPTRFELAGRVVKGVADALAVSLASGMLGLTEARFVLRRTFDQVGVEIPEKSAEAEMAEPGLVSDNPESILRTEEARIQQQIERAKSGLQDQPLRRPGRIWIPGTGPAVAGRR